MITTEAVTESLRKAVEKNGAEYIYPQPDGSCMYVHQGAPSCIVGHVIADLFPEELAAVAEWEETGDSAFWDLQEHFNFPLEDDAAKILASVQSSQDAGVPWGEAVDITLSLV